MSTDVADASLVHERALAEIVKKRDRIRYACTVLATDAPDGEVRTQDVRDWLAEYGIETSRPNASLIVNEWRREQGLDETGDLPQLTPEALAELDAAHVDALAQPTEQPAPADPATTPPPVTVETAEEPPTAAAPPAAPPPVDTEASAVSQPRFAVALFYLVATMATLLSADTSYRFFGYLGISGFAFPVELWGMPLVVDVERTLLFGVQELMLLACAVSMRAHVRRWGSAGPAQLVAWALLGGAAVAAVGLAGFTLAAGARIVFGPLLALIALHLALGLELRVRRGERVRTGALVRIGRELRERVLSRLGLSDDERDAVARTRDRAARRAARLAVAPGRTPLHRTRLQRALRVSNAAHDASARTRLLNELALLQHADELAKVPLPSPWK